MENVAECCVARVHRVTRDPTAEYIRIRLEFESKGHKFVSRETRWKRGKVERLENMQLDVPGRPSNHKLTSVLNEVCPAADSRACA